MVMVEERPARPFGGGASFRLMSGRLSRRSVLDPLPPPSAAVCTCSHPSAMADVMVTS